MTEGVRRRLPCQVPFALPRRGRHGRRDEHAAGAFDEALGAPKTAASRGSQAPAPRRRADAWRQAGHAAWHRRHRRSTAAMAEARPTRQRNARRRQPTRGLAASLDQPDDSCRRHEPIRPMTDADDGLPTQMRAEQTISAIMTIAPIARQPAPPIGHAGAEGRQGGCSRWPRPLPPSGSNAAALAAGAKLGARQQQSQRPMTRRAGEHATARRGTQPQAGRHRAPAPVRCHAGTSGRQAPMQRARPRPPRQA